MSGRDPAFAASPSSQSSLSRPDGLQSGVGLPDIEQEGERIAADTWRHPSGLYLWTDLVGAIQTAIHEERQRHARTSR